MNVLTRKLSERQLFAVDGVIAAVLVGVLSALTLRGDSDPGALALAILAAAPIAGRRRYPLVMLAVAQGLLLVSSVLTSASGPAVFVLAVGFTTYTYAATYAADRHGRGLVLAGSLLVTGGALVFRWYPQVVGDPVGQVAQMLGAGWLVIGVPWVLGTAVRLRREQRTREADRLAEQAVTDERLRIARELHDVVGHAMSVITVKAAVAARVADKRPEETKDALRVIEETGRTSLAEMRRILGILRSPGTAPVPGLDGLPALAARAREAGVEVSLEVTGSVPEGMAQSVYRIVQEALTNVIKHAAPTHCQVAFTVKDGTAHLLVTDAGPTSRRTDAGPTGRRSDTGSPGRRSDTGSPGRRGAGRSPGQRTVVAGHGMIGMRERVRAYGGEFAAGPRAGGGFEVCASWEVA